MKTQKQKLKARELPRNSDEKKMKKTLRKAIKSVRYEHDCL